MAGEGAAGVVRVLLDTTYILPTIGVEVEGLGEALSLLRMLRERGVVELYYSDFSLLEAVAKAVKLGVPETAIETGVTAILAVYKRIEPGVDTWLLAARIRRDGLRDFIDALLYALAATHKLRLLTRDAKLVEFLEKHGYPLNPLMSEKELAKLAEKK